MVDSTRAADGAREASGELDEAQVRTCVLCCVLCLCIVLLELRALTILFLLSVLSTMSASCARTDRPCWRRELKFTRR